MRHTAGGIAAGPGGRAVGVPEGDLGIGVLAVGDHRELVEAHAPVPVTQRGRERRGDRVVRALARVDDHEVIAQPVHLEETQAGRPICRLPVHGRGI